MKACPACNATYEDWIEFCFADGQPLVAQGAAGGAPPPAIDAFDLPEPVNVATGPIPPSVADADAPTARLAPLQRTPARVEAPAETRPIDLVKPDGQEAPRTSHHTIVPDDDFMAVEPVVAVPVVSTEPPVVAVAAPRMVMTPTDPAVKPAPRVPAPAPPRPVGAMAIVAVAVLLVAGGGWFLFSGPPKSPVAANVDFPKPEPTKAAPVREPEPEPEPTPEPTMPAPAADAAPVVEPVVPAVAKEAPEARKPEKGGDKGKEKPVTAASPSTVSDAPWGAPASDATTVGTLRVRSEPSGAKVFVDNKERGRTPLDVELPYGTHNVRVMQRNFKTEVRDVSIRLKELTVPFTLRPEVNNGTVTIYASGGARVAIDGSAQGPAPVTVTLSEGMHTFRLDNADGSTCSLAREVKFPGGGNASLNLKCP